MHTSPKIITLDFVELEIHSDFLVATIQEGLVFEKEHLDIFYNLFDEHYPNRKFGYISNRKFDYTVNPTCYLNSDSFTNLLGMAIWCHSEASFNTTLFEKTFYSRPFEAFYTFDECKQFLSNLISNN